MDASGAGRDTIFPDHQVPTLLFPPPPLPPLATYSYSSAASYHTPSITSFPILLITVLGILTTSVLLLTYYVFVIRCCLSWHSSSDVADLISRRRGGNGASSSLPGAALRGVPAEVRGLEEPAIQALPAFRYRKAIKDTVDTSECAVCLGEFQEEERVRILPSCLHAFHVDCIDTWLQGNANCPLCRAAITSSSGGGVCHCPLPLMDQLLRPEEVVIQVAAGTEEDTQTQQQETNTAAADGSTTDQQVSSKRKNNNAWHVSSKGEECMAEEIDRDALPMRRCFSMDSLGGGEVHLQIQKILQKSSHFHGDGNDNSSCGSSSTL